MSTFPAISGLSTSTSFPSEGTDASPAFSNFRNSKSDADKDTFVRNFRRWQRGHDIATKPQNKSSSLEAATAPPPAQQSRRLAFDINITPPRIREIRRMPTFSPLQEWEGYVTAFNQTHMIANLIDLSEKTSAGNTVANLQAEIPLEELSDVDVVKLAVGRVFRWAIGYQRTPQGTKIRVSQFVFRDLPQWTAKDVAEAASEAAQLHEFFKSSEPSDSP